MKQSFTVWLPYVYFNSYRQVDFLDSNLRIRNVSSIHCYVMLARYPLRLHKAKRCPEESGR